MTHADVPVLLIGFNRPTSMRRVIESIRSAAPRIIYFAVDGPRPHVASDPDLVHQTQLLVNELDWECEVHTLFRDVNLGCGHGVSSAISWFFDNVESGIILEDDIVVGQDFFPFVTEMLDRYAQDPRVFAVTGSQRIPQDVVRTDRGYRFSSIPQVWGWGTWRDRWQNYSLDISGWRKELPPGRLFTAVGKSPAAFALWSANFDLMARKAIDTWDLQLVYCAMRQGALTVTPNVNLVENIGWGPDSTHTQAVPIHIQPVGHLVDWNADVPVVQDVARDRWTNKHVYGASIPGLTRQAYRYLRSRVERKS